jgi:dethiobiotin synthetase
MWFLTGTDTGVGKTYAACLIVRALRRAGLKAAGFKPVCCGDRDDAAALHAAGDPSVSVDEINPVWLRTPAAPYTACIVENRPLDLDLIRAGYRSLRSRCDSVVVEGVGGWLVPLTRELSVADLAQEFELPVAVVVANRLGAINHTLLTLESIRSRGLPCAGIVLNHLPHADDDVATHTNRSMLEELTGVPILFEIRPGQREIELALA